MRNRNSVWQEGFFWPAVALCLPQAPSRISLFLLLSFLYCFGLRFGHFLRWHPLTDVIDAPLRGKISSRCLPTLLCHEQLEHCLQPSIPRFTLAQEPFHKFLSPLTSSGRRIWSLSGCMEYTPGTGNTNNRIT